MVTTQAIITALRRMRKETYIIYIINRDTLTDGTKIIVRKGNKKDDVMKLEAQDEDGKIIKLQMLDSKVIFESIGGAPSTVVKSDLLSDLYKITNGKNYKERIGVYKENEVGVTDEEKTTRKIITFEQIP